MQVLVAGHSFVRRLAFDARVRGMDLSGPGFRVSIQGKGGATICGQKTIDKEVHVALRNSKFKLLILDLGSNDLDLIRNPYLKVEKVALTYVEKAAALAARYDIRVVLCLPIPRDEKQFPGSFEITKRFNLLVKTHIKSYSNLHTWAHKGLFKKDSRYLDKHGVHLNTKGSIKYFHSIKAVIRYHVPRL